jgi:hypothetical protein
MKFKKVYSYCVVSSVTSAETFLPRSKQRVGDSVGVGGEP